jgi:hypothetical protein
MTFDDLSKVVREMPAPPCDACLWSRECTDPDACTPFKYYVQTGREIALPKRLPS